MAVFQVMGIPVISGLSVSDVGRADATISWNVLDDGGSNISGYEVQYSLNSGSTWSGAQTVSVDTRFTPTSLVPGQNYQVRLRPVNSVGSGEYETVSFSTVSLDSARNLHLVSRTLTSVSIDWAEPALDPQLVDDYLIEYSSNAGSIWSTFNDGVSANTSATITGLQTGVAYTIRVTAKSGIARSLPVEVINPAQNTPIGMQISLTTLSTSTIKVDWSGVNSGIDPITKYVFETSIDGVTWTRNSEVAISGTDSGSGTKTITGLSAGKWYYIRAAAENIAGLGPWSNIDRAPTSGFGRMTLNVTDYLGNPLKLGNYSWQSTDNSISSTGTVQATARGSVVFERVFPKAGHILMSNAVIGRDISVSGWWITAIGSGAQDLALPIRTPEVSNYTVRVVLPNGVPVPNAYVEVSGLSATIDSGNFNFTYRKAVTQGMTDPTGRLRVSGFVTGPLQATVTYQDPYLTQIRYGVPILNSTQTVELEYMPFLTTPQQRIQSRVGELVEIPISMNDPTVIAAAYDVNLIDRGNKLIASVDGEVSVIPPAGSSQTCSGAVLSSPIVNGSATLKVCANVSGEYILESSGAVSLGSVVIASAGSPPSIVPSLTLSNPSDNAVTVSWGLPAEDGGSAITGYHIDAVSSDRSLSWTLTNSTVISNRQFSLSNLNANQVWTVTVRAINANGTALPVSEEIIVVGNTIPLSLTEMTTSQPSISGQAVRGNQLSLQMNAWSPTPDAQTIQWLRNGQPISGATSSTYTLTNSDVGSQITVSVRGVKNAFRTVTLTSSALGPVANPQVTPPPRTPTVVENLGTASGKNRNFVRTLYKDFLNRDATEDEVNYWGNELTAGRVSQANLTTTLSRSDAWIQAVIRGFYVDTLGREPDAAGYAYWVGQARAGKPIADIGSFFYGSDEYFQTTGRGNYTVWINDLYQKLMLRPGDAGGVNYWVSQLNSGMSRPAVSHWFYQSPEKLGLRVDFLYSKLLNRGSDPGGRAYWAGRLYGEGDLSLASMLASSPEYFGRQFLR
jgi:hypothetical protein